MPSEVPVRNAGECRQGMPAARTRERSIASALRRCRRMMIPLACLLASGCSAAQIVNSLLPRNGFLLLADRDYGALSRQKLDIYIPATGERAKPVVIFFYGGNWQSGSKSDYLFVGQALAARGFVTIIADYRLYPEVRYPQFLEDAATAVAWTLRHLDAIGGDAAHVHLLGHSAGAYIAAMLALDPRWLGDDRKALRSMVGLAGPYDFLPLTDPILRVIFATEPDGARTQPITFADGTGPAVLLISGRDDRTVRLGNSMRLATRIREHGGVAEERYYRGVGHVSLIGAIAAPLRFLAPTLDDTVNFLLR
jgi:acetyl esterase/lipase